MPNNEIRYLRNESSTNDGFKKKRGFKKTEVELGDDLPKVIIIQQKISYRRFSNNLTSERVRRHTEKTLARVGNIELVKMYFFTFFNADLQQKFFARYGISALEFSDFNKTVLFEISDEKSFQNFLADIQNVIDSPEGERYEGKPYHLVALVYAFEFYNDQNRFGKLSETGFLISLVKSANRQSIDQKQVLLSFLYDNVKEVSYDEAFPDMIEVSQLTPVQLASLTKNFDIIKRVSTTRPIKIRPGMFGETRRSYGFTVNYPDNLPIVGIIDTGLSSSTIPLRGAVTNIHYDHTGRGAYWDENGHGTMVAGLVVLGADFQRAIQTDYTAKSKIAVLKVIHDDNDYIDPVKLLMDIKSAKRDHNIRLFNMSLTLNIVKSYNEAYCSLAYELDKLAYEEDILIVMSVGNYSSEDLQMLLNENYHPSHGYPKFFYDPSSTSNVHRCWFTNIMEPAESLNNISVGALAGNVEGNYNHDITPASELPAYYTRKFHFDQNQQVNGTKLTKNQGNKNLNKPDLVYDGGDLFKDESGIEILRSPLTDGQQYFSRSCGTSLAAPLITSMAAEILGLYPQLRMQSIKALIINNASSSAGINPPGFPLRPVNVYKKLIGAGKPSADNLLVTDDNTVSWMIEEQISFDELITIPIKLPEYIAEAGNKLHFSATMCYSFLPVQNNHLNYIPLHISFGVFRNEDASVVGSSDADKYRIKGGITWSEDFFGIERRLFSNTQKVTFNLQPADFRIINNEIAIAVRCTGKKELPSNNVYYLEKTSHPFSLAITISEIPEANASGRLNAELNAINIVENIAILDSEASLDLTNI